MKLNCRFKESSSVLKCTICSKKYLNKSTNLSPSMTSYTPENYKIEILKKLEKFKNAKEWSDFIEPLDSLCCVFKANKCGSIPCIPQLVKRLNQLMNPALPAGIHMKTIECYHSIFDSIDQKHLEEDFDALTIGLFSFSLHCRILVANEYLNLLEKIISKLGTNVEFFSKNIILGILPFLDSESSEFYNRAYLLLISFINQISQKAFYSALWRNFIDYPDLRVGILNFMNNYKLVVITDYSLVTHAMCCGLKDNNPFIIRSILEISNRDFPYVIDSNKPNDESNERRVDKDVKKDELVNDSMPNSENIKLDTMKNDEDPAKSNKTEINDKEEQEDKAENNAYELKESIEKANSDDMTVINYNKANQEIITSDSLTGHNNNPSNNDNHSVTDFLNRSMVSLNIDDRASSSVDSTSPVDKIETQQIISLDTSSSSSSSIKIVDEKEKCNTHLIHHILNIFLMKDVGINKRAYKWLNLGDQITEKDVEYLDKGLRTYLDGTDQNLCIFFRIINSLADKENLISFLIDRLIVDALRAAMNISCRKDSEAFSNLKKIAKMFLNHSIDDFYSSIYVKLSKTFEILVEADLEEIEVDISDDSEDSDSEDMIYKVKSTISNKNCNLADELVKIILFSIEILEVVDSNATSIHIPLLCHLIIKNKRKIANNTLSKFFKLFCKLCAADTNEDSRVMGKFSNKTNKLPTREIKSEEIDLFYEKVNGAELIESNLIGAIAKELSKMDIYKETELDHMFWTKSNLFEQDGVLIWSESKDCEYLVRNSGGFFNFNEKDLEIIRLFINTFGYSDLEKSFLKIFCRFLCFNYKYIDMLRVLSAYVDKNILYVNIWNDFIISKNPKFINHFPEEELTPVIHTVFPTANIEDMCLFLSETISNDKFIDILLRTATLAYPESSSFVNLILDLSNPLPLLKYMLEIFYHQQEKINDYQCVTAILYILQILMDCNLFVNLCKSQEKVKISNLGEIEVSEGVSKMIIQILTDENKKFDDIQEVKRSLKRLSAIIDLHGHLTSNSSGLLDNDQKASTDPEKDPSKPNDSNIASNNSEILIEFDEDSPNHASNKLKFGLHTDPTKTKLLFDNHPIADFDSIEVGTSNLIEKHSIHLKKETVYKLGFDCLYKMYKNGIDVKVTDTVGLKAVICESKNDFYVLKRSIFLVENDFHFIFENYMHFYKQILTEISQMPIKNNFFAFLADPKMNCSVEIFAEAFPYFTQIKTIKNEDLFYKAHSLMTTRVKKGGALYKRFKKAYKRVFLSQATNSKPKSKSKQKKVSNENLDCNKNDNIGNIENSLSVFKDIVSESVVADFDPALSPLVVLSNENLAPVLLLADMLYQKNQNLFISTFVQGEDSLFLFSILPFKIELFKKLLAVYKEIKFPLKVLHAFLENIPYEARAEIIRTETELIRTNFAIGNQDTVTQRFIVELFKNQPQTDISRLVLCHLLNLYELKIDQVIKQSYNFDNEISLMKKLVRIPMKDISLITVYKNCCYSLLQSRTYRETALKIIYSYILENPNCKIFIDQFIIYFSRNFFTFGLLTKKRILELISASSHFDPFLAIENAFSGMDSSFFMSAQSEELLKINSLKKISFLILSQPKNKYSTMADNFVVLINSYINSTSDIKYEILRLCSILMFKIDNHFLITLYPILVADFMNVVNLKDIRVLGEIFKFVDLSIWLNSPIFDFKTLFVEKHYFREQLVTKIFKEQYQERPIDMNAKKLPNFVTRTIKTFTSWSDFSYFLAEMPKYYRYKESCMIENDYEAVENNLVESFLDSK